MDNIWTLLIDNRGLMITISTGIIALYIYSKILTLPSGKFNSKTFLKGLSTKVDGKIIDRKQITHDTIILRVSLDHDNQRLGLPICQHIRI